MLTGITLNTDTFHAVSLFKIRQDTVFLRPTSREFSILIRKNTGQRKLISSHILRSVFHWALIIDTVNVNQEFFDVSRDLETERWSETGQRNFDIFLALYFAYYLALA